MTGGVAVSDTVMERGALGNKWWLSGAAWVAAGSARASPQVTMMVMGGFTGRSFQFGNEENQTVSPWAKRAIPSESPYLSMSFDRRTRSLGLVENVA